MRSSDFVVVAGSANYAKGLANRKKAALTSSGQWFLGLPTYVILSYWLLQLNAIVCIGARPFNSIRMASLFCKDGAASQGVRAQKGNLWAPSRLGCFGQWRMNGWKAWPQIGGDSLEASAVERLKVTFWGFEANALERHICRFLNEMMASSRPISSRSLQYRCVRERFVVFCPEEA